MDNLGQRKERFFVFIFFSLFSISTHSPCFPPSILFPPLLLPFLLSFFSFSPLPFLFFLLHLFSFLLTVSPPFLWCGEKLKRNIIKNSFFMNKCFVGVVELFWILSHLPSPKILVFISPLLLFSSFFFSFFSHLLPSP